MALLSPLGPFRAFDNNGDPLNGGKLYTYEAGTTTPKATYTDAGGLTANANPIILDASGYANVWLGSGGYKFILKTSADSTLWTIDDIGGDSANAFGSTIVTTSTNLNVTTAHRNSLVRCTAALTLSLLAAASAEEGFYFLATNASSGNITIDPDGAETIDGASTYTLYPNDSVIVICSGTAWFTAFSLPVAGVTTNQISTSGASGVVIKNSGGTTVATIGASNGTVTALAGNLTLGGTLSGASITSNTLPYASIASSSIATAAEIRSETASKLVDAAQLLTSLRPYSTTTATTSGSDAQFTSINTGIRRIVLVFSGVSSNGTGLWTIEIGDSGGFETSGYVGTVARDGGSASFSTSFVITSTTVAADTYDGIIELYRGDSSTNTWGMRGALSSLTTGPFVHVSSGSKSLSAELDRLRVVAGGNTFDAGKITCEAFYF